MARVFLFRWMSSRSTSVAIVSRVASDIRQYHASASLHTLRVSVDLKDTLYVDISLRGLYQHPSLRRFVFKGSEPKRLLYEFLKDKAVHQAADVELTIHDCDLDVDPLNEWCNRRTVRSLNLRDVTFSVASKDAIAGVVRSILRLAEEVTWDLDRGTHFETSVPDGRALGGYRITRYWVKEIINSDSRREYVIKGTHDWYYHQLVILW